MQRITSRILSSPRYNLWKNSLDTIDWFQNIENKKVYIHPIRYHSFTRPLLVGWLFGFYGISTFVGYLMPNPF